MGWEKCCEVSPWSRMGVRGRRRHEKLFRMDGRGQGTEADGEGTKERGRGDLLAEW